MWFEGEYSTSPKTRGLNCSNSPDILQSKYRIDRVWRSEFLVEVKSFVTLVQNNDKYIKYNGSDYVYTEYFEKNIIRHVCMIVQDDEDSYEVKYHYKLLYVSMIH